MLPLAIEIKLTSSSAYYAINMEINKFSLFVIAIAKFELNK